MEHAGHIGVALLTYSPVAFLLEVFGQSDLVFLGAFGTVALSMVPDLDLRLPFVAHRGPTHSFGFGIVVGMLASIGGYSLRYSLAGPSGRTLLVFGFLVGMLAVCSHLLADALTPMGVAPLWPVSDFWYSANLFAATNPVANYALLGIGASAIGCMLWLADSLSI